MQGSDIITKFSILNSVAIEECWRDSRGHPTADCQEYLAEHVSLGYKNASVPKCDFVSYSHSFRVIKADDLLLDSEGADVFEESNSLMTVRWLKLEVGSNISIDMVDKNLQVHGVLINYGSMNATEKAILEFSTVDGNYVADISNSFLPEKPLKKVSVLYRSVRGVVGCKRVSVPGLDCNSRFIPNSKESIGLVSLLVGPKLSDIEFS